MRILWFCSSPFAGGAERAQLAMFREIVAQHPVVAVVPDTARRDDLDDTGIKVHSAVMHRFERTLNPIRLFATATSIVQQVRMLTRVIRSESINVIHVGNLWDLPVASLASRATGVPVVWLIENPERFDLLNCRIINSSRPAAIIGTSSAILNQGVAAGIRAPILTTIGNPYNDRAFSQRPLQPRDGGPLRIGFAGVLGERKGVLELCRAFILLSARAAQAGLPPIELHLAGTGTNDYRRKMIDALESGGVLKSVRFLEHLKVDASMRDFYWSLDVCVMLSKREGLSVAMLEAMACGLPCAVTSPWGDDAIVDGVNGIRLASDSPESVADALWPLVVDPDRCRTMGARAAQSAHGQFSPAVVAGKLLDAYVRVKDAA
jgi:glycosyltransferase involved in cell wall biosynthesis